MNNREVVVVSAVRTAIGEYGGSLKDISPTDLAGMVIKESVKRAGLDSESIEHCVIGSVTHSDRKDMYMSRSAALKAGLSETTPAVTVNRLCGSGLQSIISAAQLILLADCNVAVAGGAESMSRVPYWIPKARFGLRMGDSQMIDPMVGALTCPVDDTHMGITAENVADEWQISREAQDALALVSHQRAEFAINDGRFVEQILPVEIKTRQGITVFEQDEHVRFGASAADFSKLRTVFKKEGSVTAGNASGINDAAAALVLMEKGVAKAKGLQPMAKLVTYAFAGVVPKYMGIGPVPAIINLLDKSGLTIDDIDIWEINEAFAAQALAVVKELKLDPAKVNPNGSGISLGHPIGATGSVITVKALYELNRTAGKYAVVAMCIGGGQGIAALFERI